MSTSTTRILTGGAATAALAAALLLAAPTAASAHVGVTPDTPATAGGHGVLTFAFSHGCDGSPTTAVSIGIPDGLSAVSPTLAPGWDIAVDREGGDGMVRTVTFTATEPVPADIRAALELGVTYAPDSAGETLVFPVLQTCEVGEHAWTEVAAEGEDPHALDSPAPVLTVGAAAGHTEEPHGGHADAAATDAEAPVADGLAVGLGAGGLALGAAALVTAIAGFRRARR